jgi:long-chain acyl-CoA synthetase
VLEGYGLTESSPFSTVARPGNKLLRGSVGKPLPGVEVKIDNPDANGVGEVVARRPERDARAITTTKRRRGCSSRSMAAYSATSAASMTTETYSSSADRRRRSIDSNGKNIYPTRSKTFTANRLHKRVERRWLVRRRRWEKIASLVVPDYEKDIALSRTDVNKKIEETFSRGFGVTAFFKRVKVLHVTPFELPRTATRIVKRPEVVENAAIAGRARQTPVEGRGRIEGR